MNKVQFRLFIEDCLAYHVKEVENRCIPSEELADAWKPYVKPSDMTGLSFKDLPVIDKLISNSHIQELSDKGLKHNLDDVLESKWLVSLGWDTKSKIHNLIHIYKTIDWEMSCGCPWLIMVLV